MKRMVKWAVILLVLCLCGLAIASIFLVRQYQALADDEPNVALSPNKADITYCTMDGEALRMDLYYPENMEAPAQLLIYFHGGSFTGGDKRKGSGSIDIPAMTARGYAVAAVNYRLMPEYPFPSEVEDAKCAVRFLRAHAAEYNLRTVKIGIWGGSAGGHLAAMIGLTRDQPDFDTGEFLEQPSQVDAVVEMFGPTDLTLPMSWLQRLLLQRAFGTSDPQAEVLRQASPVQYITPKAPPFLILQGEQDSAVPLQQAQVFYQKMVETGNTVTLVTVKNANHNFKPTGGPIQPTRQQISIMMADFFDHWLK